VGVVTQSDKPVGRRQILTPPHIKAHIQKEGLEIPILQPATLKDPQVIGQIRSMRPDFIVVAAYGKILPKEVLDIAPCINLHASLLPKYRGASPIQQALLEGETITGVTAMLMDEGLDTGDILAYDVLPIAPDDTAVTLFEKLSHSAAALTPKVLDRFSAIAPLPQSDVDATYCKKITKADGLVTFEDAKKLYDRYRAFIHWPGVYLQSGLKLKKMRLLEREGAHRPGEILSIDDEGIAVGCGRGSLLIERVQPPSKKEMAAVDYIHGRRLGVKDILV
jgi:methionyl-tRNA formyltransferase